MAQCQLFFQAKTKILVEARWRRDAAANLLNVDNFVVVFLFDTAADPFAADILHIGSDVQGDRPVGCYFAWQSVTLKTVKGFEKANFDTYSFSLLCFLVGSNRNIKKSLALICKNEK